MLKNNIEVDVKVKCIEGELTQAQLAERTTPAKKAFMNIRKDYGLEEYHAEKE